MGSVQQYVFPGAVLSSLILAFFIFTVTAGMSASAEFNSAMPIVSTGGQGESQAAQQAQEEANASSGDDDGQQVKPKAKCKVSETYPQEIRQWCELITKFSKQHELEPDLIAALIWQESGGDPSAYSRSGAVGLMQVMPRDGLAANFMCPNGPCFSSRPTIDELEDPTFNVKYGTGMLANLFNRYGDMREALKYYGPKDVGYYYADIVLGIYSSYRK